MKISASIYSGKGKDPEELIRELDAHQIDMLHVDCEDDLNVFDDLERIRKISKTPIDLHLITAEPERFYAQIEKLKIEYVSFQYENMKRLPAIPQGSACKFGLSLIASTPLEVFNEAETGYSFIMMMSTTPGKSGGEFNRDSFGKIIACRNTFPKTRIHVDGGVNDEIAYILRLLGVSTFVTGSYLMNHATLSSGMLSFHQRPDEHRLFKVAEFATPVKFLPVLRKSQLNFQLILRTIEKFGLGFVLITDEQGKLNGVVSNADVRRSLLKNTDNLNAVNPMELINEKPVCIGENNTVADIMHLLNELNFIVLFLPVTDEKNNLKGAVLLNNLTRF